MSRRTRALTALVAIAATLAGAGPVRAQLGTADTPRAAQSIVLDPTLDQQLAAAAPTDLLRVFVRAADAATAEAMVADAGLLHVETFRQVGIVVADGTPAQINRVLDDPRLDYVEADGPIRFSLDTSHEATRGAVVKEGLALATPAGIERVQYKGRGVSVAVVDSGIDATHPFLTKNDGTSAVAVNLKLVCHDIAGSDRCQNAWIDGADDTDSPTIGGHGTHVAGIVGGRTTELSDGRIISGAAPAATLIGLSIGTPLTFYGPTSGLNWVLDHHADPCGDGSCPPIKVVNNSWGSSGADHNPESTRSQLVNKLVAEGVVVVFAAGNDDGDGSTNQVGPDALNPTPGVLGVASYNDNGIGTRDGAISDFSSRGEAGRPWTYPDIAAPGSNILSSCRVYLAVCSTGLDFVEGGDYNTISGTSMAAPHIAGIVAQLFEAARDHGIALTPAMVEDILEDTAHPFAAGAPYEWDATNPDTGTSFDKGHGLVDVVEAVSRLLGASGPAPASTCTLGGPVLVDPAGDAHNFFVAELPTESSPSLDIVRADITEWDTVGDGATDSLRFTLTVDDLTDDPPTGSVGEYFDWNFDFEGSGYFLGMGWDRTAEPSFVVGNFSGVGETRNTLLDLDGEVHTEADTFVAYLPFDAFHQTIDGGPLIVAGSVLGGHEIVSRYDMGRVVPDNDKARGACPYTVGLGTVPPPVEEAQPVEAPVVGELPDGDADATLHVGETVTFVSEPGTATRPDPLIGVGVTGNSSETYTIDLIVASDAPVSVTAVADQPEVQDIDLTVVTQDGTTHTSAAEGGEELVEFTTPYVQRITVTVDRFLTIEAGFNVTVSLG